MVPATALFVLRRGAGSRARRLLLMRVLVAVLLAALVIPAAPAVPAQAQAAGATYTVNRADDPAPRTVSETCNGAAGDCSLREAILKANANPGVSIVFDSALNGTPILLVQRGVDNTGQLGDLDINASVTITGNGPSNTIIQAASGAGLAGISDKVLAVAEGQTLNNATIQISGLTLRWGNYLRSNTLPGGGLNINLNGSGNTATLSNVVIDRNLTNQGGGGLFISYNGSGNSVTLDSVVISGNTANRGGGGLGVSAAGSNNSLTLNTVTLQNNRALTRNLNTPSHGGGLYVAGDGLAVTVTGGTFAGNSTQKKKSTGGGIAYYPGTSGSLTINGATVQNNNAGGLGGGISLNPTSAAPVITVQNATIRNNTSGLGGESGGGGIVINGTATTTPITLSKNAIENNLENTAAGTKNGGGGVYVAAGNVNLVYSRIVNNRAGQANLASGLQVGGGSVTARNNWWGCSRGPNPSLVPATTCDTVNSAFAAASYTPYLQLRVSASPASIVTNQASNISASFNTNSDGGDVSGNLDRLIGLPVTWSSVAGALSSQQATIQANGVATAIYTAQAANVGNQVAAVVDRDSITPTPRSNVMAITVGKADASVAITSHVPNPSQFNQSVAVSFSLSPAFGSTPTAPTGTVTIVDNGNPTNFCEAELPDTTCNIVLTDPGSRELKASYSGDANFNSGESALVAHTVTDNIVAITNRAPASSVTGQSVTFTTAITKLDPADEAFTPSGTIQIKEGASTLCTIDLSLGNTCSAAFSSAGTKVIYALYSGDENFTPSTSINYNHAVQRASTSTSITNAAALNGSATVVGQAYQVDVAVVALAPGGGLVSGEATISDGTDSCKATITAGSGSCMLVSSTVGNKFITASYTTSTSYFGSTSPSARHQVNPAATTLTITGHVPAESVVNQAVKVSFNLAVTPPGGGTPGGTVLVSAGSGISCSATPSEGFCTLVFPTPGDRSITASYAGTPNYTGSTATPVTQKVGKANTTVSIVSHLPDPSLVNETVTVQVSVLGEAGNSPTQPGGTVTVSADSTGGGESCDINLAVASSCGLKLTGRGPRTLKAVYSGDNNFNGSLVENVNHQVQNTTTRITSLSVTPSVVGQPVSIYFNVTAYSPGTPTGTVTVRAGSNILCSGSLTEGSCEYTFSMPGKYALTATYNGDANFTESTSPVVNHDVNQASTELKINTHAPNPSVTGQTVPVTFSLTVLSGGGGTPTGDVTIISGENTLCTAPVASGVCPVTFTMPGTYNLVAIYGGDDNFVGNSSLPVEHQVDKARTTVSIGTRTPASSVTNQAVLVNFSVAVTSPGAGTPEGTVTISDGVDSCTAALAEAACSIRFRSVGTRSLTATYSGDTRFEGSTSSTVQYTVAKANTTTLITSDLPDPSLTNQAFTVQFSVTGAEGNQPGAPSGKVIISVAGRAETCEATLPAQTSCELTLAVTGTFNLTASYQGDGNFNSSTSPVEAHVVQNTITTITSAVPAPSVVGQEVTVNFSVTAVGGGSPSNGPVTVSDGAGGTCTANLPATSCKITFTTAGLKKLVANYGGDSTGTYTNSTSPAFDQQVNPAETTTTIDSDTPDPSNLAQAYTVTFTVAAKAPGTGTPSGLVTVSDGKDTCTGSLTAGKGQCSLVSSTAGVKNLVATYQGNDNYQGSASAGTPHNVNKATPVLAIISDIASPSAINELFPVVFSMDIPAGAAAPTGQVTLGSAAGSVPCKVTLPDNTCEVVFTAIGTPVITASYPGDSNYNAVTASSNPVTHPVEQALTLIRITGVTPRPSVVGQEITISYTLEAEFGVTPVAPTGNVIVSDGEASKTCALSAGKCTLILTSAGTRNLTATYQGDVNFVGSDSDIVSHEVRNTKTSITEITPGLLVVGQRITVKFLVEPIGGAGTPTGTVKVSSSPENYCLASITPATGAGSCTILFGSPGTYQLVAEYSGDTNFTVSASTPQAVEIGKAESTVVFLSDAEDPSAVGELITVSIRVNARAPGAGTPTGNVLVTSSAGPECTIALDKGAGTCQLAFSQPGSLTLTATYAGDASFIGSSATEPHEVSKADTTISITGDPTNPSVVNQPARITFELDVVPPASGQPTGKVIISDGAGASCEAVLPTSWCDIRFPTVGTNKVLTASYEGDDNYNGSTSNGVYHDVEKADLDLVITSHQPDPSLITDPVTIQFSLTNEYGIEPTAPTGKVTITAMETGEFCEADATAGTCELTLNAKGLVNLRATYPGDDQFNPATSVDELHDVQNNITTIEIIDPAIAFVGEEVTITFKVTPYPRADDPTPTGLVTVSDGLGNECQADATVGQCSITFPTAGMRKLTASYAGNGDYSKSSTTKDFEVKQATTQVTITAGPETASVAGQSVTVSFTLSLTSGAGTPTGSVTLSDGTDTCTVDAPAIGATGSCTWALTTASPSPKTLTVTYLGDNNFAPSSDSMSHTVNKADVEVIILEHLPQPAALNQAVTVMFSVAAVAPGSGTPGGNVTINSAGSAGCTAPVSEGKCTLTFQQAGTQTITATYAGDANFNGNFAAVEHLVNKYQSSISITTDLSTDTLVGQPVKISFVVNGFGTPTGKVTLQASPEESCTVTLPGEASCNLTFTQAGDRQVRAIYEGDNNNLGSSSNSVPHTINPASTSLVIVSRNPETSAVGEAVTVQFSLTVNLPGGGSPTGKVVISDEAGTGCEATLPQTACAITFPTSGIKSLKATYSGDSNYLGSSSATVEHSVTGDGLIDTSTVIVSHLPNPSVVGETVTVSVMVRSVTPGTTPSGHVTVRDQAHECTVTLTDGAGSCELTYNTAGIFEISAVYGGDTEHNGSQAANGYQVVTSPGLINTTTVLLNGVEPTVTGQGVMYSFSVQPASGAGTPTGTVTVFSDRGYQCEASVADGQCQLVFKSAGTQQVQAVYSGDAIYNPSASNPLEHQVEKAGTSIVITERVPSPSAAGEVVKVTFDLTVNEPGAGDPTGLVEVSAGAGITCTAQLPANACSLTFTTTGTYTLVATYKGDEDFAVSQSAEVTQTVGLRGTQVTITTRQPETSVVGQPVLVSYSVSALLPGGELPTGTVIVTSDDGKSCSASVAAGGCPITFTSAGVKNLSVEYQGDANHAGSSAANSATHTVGKAATQASITNINPQPSFAGREVTITFAIGAVAPGTGTPLSGSVVVTASNGLSCTVDVSAGNCKLTFADAGDYTLSVVYQGNDDYEGSTSTEVAHTVVPSETQEGVKVFLPIVMR